MVRGTQVSFLRPGDGDSEEDGIILPPSYGIVHDVSGQYLRPCDIYFLRFQKTGGRIEDENLIEDLKDYYGEYSDLSKGTVDIPMGPWVRIASVRNIRYYRAGNLRGHYEHPFSQNVLLYQCDRPLSWRLRLPDDCEVTAHGFVRP